jgi:hypothetical protein
VNKTVCILYWTIDTIFGERAQDIYINAVDADGPKVSPSSIEASLCSIQESSEFSYENLLAQVKNSCFRPERLIFLDSEMEPLKVAEHFQVSLQTKTILSLACDDCVFHFRTESGLSPSK